MGSASTSRDHREGPRPDRRYRRYPCETQADVVVNYLPVGSEEATKWYTEQILTAGCAMVNCIPVFIAREPYWQKRFVEAGVPVIGDDIKSQVGATIVHRVLTRLMRERGVRLERTSQLNVGGNTDFLNMLERERLESKKISKTNAVTSQLTTTWARRTSTSAPATTWNGSTIASGPTSAWRAAPSATCRSISSSSSRWSTHPTLRVSSSTRFAAPRSEWIAAWRGRSRAEQLLHEVSAGAASGRRVPPMTEGFIRGEGPGATAVSQG